MSNSKLLCCEFLLIVFFISNTVAQDSWSQGADMPTARGANAVVTVNGKIYAIGGNLNYNIVEEYDPETDNWTTKESMPTGRTDFSGGDVNGKIYAIGGWFINTTLSTVEEYDPATDTWTAKSPMPATRWGHATCTVNEKIYVIGGATGWPVEEIYGTILEYDPITDKWTTKAPIPTPRWFLSCSVVNGEIYAIGGNDNQGTVSFVQIYNPETDTWTSKSSMPTARWGLATDTVNGKIYAIGGGDVYPPIYAYSIVEEYDPVTDTWATKSPMPAGRIALTACSVNGKIYVPGGGGLLASDAYAEVYIYDPGNATSIENSIIKHDNFHLHQNYPNPFNSTTHISFDVQKNCFVTLKVYDVLCRHVSTLVNRNMNEGHYKVQFNGEGLPLGIYFCRIEMESYSKTRKMLLSK